MNVQQFKHLSVNELLGNSYDCECGLVHDPGLDMVETSATAVQKGIDYLLQKARGPIMLVSDSNTYEILGKKLFEMLKEKRDDVFSYVIPERNNMSVVPNESTIGETIIRMPRDIDLFVSVGSGVVNDIVRNISYHLQKDYVSFGTAPSMDGYASITSALIINNKKESMPGQIPTAIFGDIDILTDAPYEMLTAGFGDVLSKYNAVREWRFSRDLNQEHYCPETAGLILNAADKCSESALLLKQRDKQAVINVMDALILSGIAMGMYTNTRPGSGSEHHLVHYWDIEFIKRGWEHPLHGNSVGVALCVICRLYDMVEDTLPVDVMQISTKQIESVLLEAGCEISPKNIGIPKDIFYDSVLYGNVMSSNKYTILTHLSKHDPELLKQCAEQLCDYYYA